MRNIEISNSDNVIDSRDVIARIADLEEERERLSNAVTDAQEAVSSQEKSEDPDETPEEDALEEAETALLEWDAEDEGQELKALKALQNEAEGYASDWSYGATLIAESYFVEYCQELLADIGDIPRNLPDYLVIDWEATAENLKVDYTEVDFNGTYYLVR